MESTSLLHRELQGSVEFFLDFTNLDPNSPGFGLTVDNTRNPKLASIAATGSALSAWVIASERGFLSRERALDITRGTLHTLLNNVSHHRGFFAHFVGMEDAQRFRKSEYSTIDTALCLNGVITALGYFQDADIQQMAQEILQRVDWKFIVFETEDGQARFHMAYNPDRDGDYVHGDPGFISQWDMAAEQKMMYLQAANHVEPELARRLYAGFRRDTGTYDGQEIIVNPGGNLFAYQFSEAWLDTAKHLDPDGVDWFNNTRLATLANRSFCIEQSDKFKTYGPNSWGISAGDAPWGYDVSGAPPSLDEPEPNGIVSIYGGVSSLPFVPELALEMMEYLYREHPQTWGKYGFFDAYNLDVDPIWYSNTLYGIDKGCSMLMVENYLSGLIWDTYTNSSYIQNALKVLNFVLKEKGEAS
jgi:hypothetical protein